MKVLRKRGNLNPSNDGEKTQTVSFALKWERSGRLEARGRKERKNQNKTRVTNIFTNEKVVVLQTKVNSGLPGAGETKRNSQGIIILKAGMVFISGGGVAVVVFSWGALVPLLPGN